MATIKVKLRPSLVKGRAGTIFYQISHRRTTQQITTSIKLHPHEWDPVKERIMMDVNNRVIVQNRIDCDTALLKHIVKDFEHKLDAQYVAELWNAVEKTSGEAKPAIEELIKEQLILKNIVWALRLRLYYNMSADDVLPYLAGSGSLPLKKDVLIEPVMKIISKPLDIYSEWQNWNYADLLNPAYDVTSWTIDPRYLQRAANAKIHKMALRMFHRYPCSSAILVPWFMIRQLELDYICTAAEGLRLNVGEEQTKEFAGV